MASTVALFTAFSGLTAQAKKLESIGNNIANVNTTAFKSSQLVFAPQLSRTISEGSAPQSDTGGTNPFQVGLGVTVAGSQRDLSNGSLSITGNKRDMAIDGAGYFVVDRNGQQLFTRAGGFRQDADLNLVTIDGDRVQGFAVDDKFALVPGQVADLKIPVGTLTLAEATRTVDLSGNLNADGDLPSGGSVLSLSATATAGFSLVSGATVPPTPPNVLETSSLLVEIEDPLLVDSGTPLFSDGQSIELRGAERGQRTLPTATLAIGASTTVQDLIDFLDAAIGISTGAGPNPDGRTPGASLDAATGILSIVGNTGTVNDIDLDSADLRLLAGDGSFVRQPFVAGKSASADGESIKTSMIVFDSLGTPIRVDLSMVLDSKGSAGTTWRYFVESADDTDLALQVGTGLVSFDNFGQLTSPPSAEVQIDRDGTGAATPLVFSLLFTSESDSVTSLTDTDSSIAATSQDGAPIGTLVDFGVGEDGTITGAFSNGLTRTLGQVALATFRNAGGLVDEGGGLFRTGSNSGSAIITSSGQFGTGRIVSGSLELSNVDLSREFTEMILTSTGYTASSRVARTADQLLQQLLLLGQ